MIIDKAIEFIQRGHCKSSYAVLNDGGIIVSANDLFSFKDEIKQCCIFGALILSNKLAGEESYLPLEITNLIQLKLSADGYTGTIVEYNDEVSTTQADVIRLLEYVKERLVSNDANRA